MARAGKQVWVARFATAKQVWIASFANAKQANRVIILRGVILPIALMALASAGFAGQSCEKRLASPADTENAALAAARLQSALNSGGHELAIVARIGQDLRKHDLLYSHAAFAVRDAAAVSTPTQGSSTASNTANTTQRPWHVLHLLNTCGTDQGALFREGLVNFYLDGPLSYQTKVLFLPTELEAKVLAALQQHKGKQVFQSHYSVIAKPYSNKRQNSTAWLLEVIAAASVEGVDTRAEAFSVLRARQYAPEIIRIPYTQRIAGGLFRANAVFTDHPLATRLSGRYPVSSVRSIFRFLRANSWVALELTLVPQGMPITPGD
jgi:hypothetical protein